VGERGALVKYTPQPVIGLGLAQPIGDPVGGSVAGMVAALAEGTGALVKYTPQPVAGLGFAQPIGDPVGGSGAAMVAALAEATAAPTASAAMTVDNAARHLLGNMMRLPRRAGRPGTPPVNR
jgi:hypothetical protein